VSGARAKSELVSLLKEIAGPEGDEIEWKGMEWAGWLE
jgi:hypothetical protein